MLMTIKSTPTKKLLIALVYLLGATLFVSCASNPNEETMPPVDQPAQVSETVLPTQNPIVVQASPTPESNISTPEVPSSTEISNIYDQSVLSPEQKEALYQTSLQFIANTEEEGFAIGMELDYSNYGHPGLVCGPLASGILRAAGLLNKYINLKDFWLLSPRDPYTISSILEVHFPRDQYLWFKTDTALDKFDFQEFPLYTGDFLYFYAGALGTYEHMLAISRVDNDGKVYAVSNYLSDDQGYLIHEFMLYDPNDPGVGYFYEMANRSKSGGTTGFGGFELWRPIMPIVEPSLAALNFSKDLDKIIDPYVNNWNILIKEIGGDTIYDRRTHELISTFASIKLPIASLVFKALEENGIEDIPEYLSMHSVIEYGRSIDQLLKSMLYSHDPEASQLLESWLYRNINVQNILTDWGLNDTNLAAGWTTVNDISLLFEGLYTDKFLSPQSNTYLLDLLESNSQREVENLGTLRNSIAENDKLFILQESNYYQLEEIFELVLFENNGSSFLVVMNGYSFNEIIYASDNQESNFLEDAASLIWEYLNERTR